MIDELLQDIQVFLNNENTTVDEKQEYERLLEEFNQIPSYVERFTHGNTQEIEQQSEKEG